MSWEAVSMVHVSDPILDALDPEQRQVAVLLDRPLVVLAGAGTGKTRAITHRVAHAVREGRYARQRRSQS